MSIVSIGGAGIALPYPSALYGYSAFSGTNEVTLQGGQVLVFPAGTYWVTPGPCTFLQYLDPVSNLWVVANQLAGAGRYVNSDGANWRLANLTGCPVGAIVTNSGTGYTSAPTVTPSSGSSTWTAIVGGAVNTTVTVGTAGSGYTFPPNVWFSAPPNGGIQATGYATISGGAVTAVTVTNQGAGYTSAPTITFSKTVKRGNILLPREPWRCPGPLFGKASNHVSSCRQTQPCPWRASGRRQSY
jgi:hypothetical protein